MQAAGILAAICLGFGLLCLQLGGLRGLRGGGLLLGLVQLGGRNEDGHIGQPVFRGFVAGDDEHLGVEVRDLRRSKSR